MVIIGPLNIGEDGLMCCVENAEMQIDKTKLGTGTLYVTANSLCWKANGNDDGISIPWRKISVHAISTTPQRCVYLMLDFLLIWPGITDQRNGNGHAGAEIQNEEDADEDEGHVEDEDHEMSEIWLFPSNVNDVDKIYSAMAECQVLHPDTDNILSDDDDDEGQEFMDAYENGDPDEVVEGDMENLTIEDDNRFADANED